MTFKGSRCLILSLYACLTTSCVALNSSSYPANNDVGPIAPVDNKPEAEVSKHPMAEILQFDRFFDSPEDHPLLEATCRVVSEDGIYSGSGVFIEKNVVMTAAHLARHCEEGYVIIEFNGEHIHIIDIWLPTGDNKWESTSRKGDLALLQLECEVEGVEPLDMLFENPYGYGVSQYEDVFTAGCSLGYKKKSKVGSFFYYGVLQDAPYSIKVWSPAAQIWYGDSGGPVAVKVGDEFFIIGIISGFDFVAGSVVDTSACNVGYYKQGIEDYLNNL